MTFQNGDRLSVGHRCENCAGEMSVRHVRKECKEIGKLTCLECGYVATEWLEKINPAPQSPTVATTD